MSARIPPGFAEIWQRFSVVGDPEFMFTAVGCDLAAGVPANQANTNTILQACQTGLRPLVSSSTTLDGGHIIWGNDGGDIRVDASIASQAGTGGASPLPPNVAMLIRKNTGLGGRRNRGRMYLPGMANTGVGNNGVLSAAQTTTYDTAANSWFGGLLTLAEVEELVLFHQAAPFTPTPLFDVDVDPRVATQRRRLRP